MTTNTSPWIRGRGLDRLLARETNISDLIQFLSDRDPSPWAELVGFVPDTVVREALKTENKADLLLLTSGTHRAVVEVKLGHQMSTAQQEKYEALRSAPALYLAALTSDNLRLAADSTRWRFLDLSHLVGRWESVDDELAQAFARSSAGALRAWDQVISDVFEVRSADRWKPLTVLDQKFLARVVSRRAVHHLHDRGRMATADVANGGGLPPVQGWTPIRGEGKDRAFIAEVRWSESKPGGELRFGVDFDPRPDHEEDEEVRRAAYELARSMDADIEYASLRAYLDDQRPDLARLIRRDKPCRPNARGDWENVLVHGFEGAPLANGGKNTRQQTTPDFFGDGALRHEAIADISFDQASARDLIDLIDTTLT